MRGSHSKNHPRSSPGRGGGRGGRGGRGGGGPRFGGPSLPASLRDQVGAPAKRKERDFREGPQKPLNNLKRQDRSDTARKNSFTLEKKQSRDRDADSTDRGPRGTDRQGGKSSNLTSRENSRHIASSSTTVDASPISLLPSGDDVDDRQAAGTPFSGVSRKRKQDPNALTPLARMLAAQSGDVVDAGPAKEGHGKDSAERKLKKQRLSDGDNLQDVRADKTSKKKRKSGPADIALDPAIMRFTDLGGGGSLGGGPTSKEELDEEDEIAWLEYKLGMAGPGGKKKQKKEVGPDGIDWDDDGLDDLLDFADTILPGKSNGSGAGGEEGGSSDFSGEENDFEDSRSVSERSSVTDEDGDEDQEPAGEIEGSDESDALGDENDMLEDYWTEDDEDDEDNEDDKDAEGIEQQDAGRSAVISSQSQKKVRDSEIRSVRFVDEDTSGVGDTAAAPVEPSSLSSNQPITGRYVPPHLRAAMANASSSSATSTVEKNVKSERLVKLERKLQGLLNKLSESNVESILGEIEALYRENSRKDVTTTLSELILVAIADKANLLDSFVILYAALVAALYKIIGMEFGANLLQDLMTRYTSLEGVARQTSTSDSSDDTVGKRPLNLLSLLAQLYNFQVVACRLIYDLIKSYIDMLTTDGTDTASEFPVEALLRIFKCSGPQLRSDDPTSMKDIVQLVQTRTSGRESQLTPRAKFMIETMGNISANKSRHNVPGGEVGAESSQRMKKFLAGLTKKRQIMAYDSLRVSLSDLQNAETRGRWWMVGAAWSGDPLREQQLRLLTGQTSHAPKKTRGITDSDDEELEVVGKQDNTELLKLARKQGMNTDVRRTVFVTMMTSDDYIHACEQLSTLKYTEVQQREFIRVALHCCGTEQTYNPYYSLILARLCEESYSHRFTLQYAIWDFLRDMGEAGVGGESHGGGSSSMFGDLDDDDQAGEKEKRNRRSRNIGMLLAWVVGKGGADLTIFKTKNPLFKISASKDATGLKVQRQALKETLSRATMHESLGEGISFFLTTRLKPLIEKDSGRGLLKEFQGLDVGTRCTATELEIMKQGMKVALKVIVGGGETLEA